MEEIKATLLQHADSLLLSAYEQDRDGEHKDILLQVGLYLTMSEVALQYHLPTVAVNTALACARLLQDEEACVHRYSLDCPKLPSNEVCMPRTHKQSRRRRQNSKINR